MIPAACIFDLDGVIVETAHSHYKAWKKLADTLNIPFGKEQNEALKGVSRRKSLEKILAMGNKSISEERFQKLMDQKNKWYQEDIANLTPDDILEGIPEFLGALKKMGIKLAIGSSSKNTKYIMDYLQINDLFDAVIDGTMVTHTKPDPEVFLRGAEALGVSPSDCIVFEDAISGVQAAKAGGMKCVGVGSEENLGEADLVIQTFKGLTPKKLFEQLNT
ncbi:MAG TPA: beta-phosphoglucomutase [Balneolaceae bacterium]|nr:beta-phosphoglucomutase [Balneolaceae bacterium]